MFKLTVTYFFASIIGLFMLSKFFLPSGYVLSGHDSGLPFDAGAFLESRFFAWDDKIGFGVDNSYLFGSITLHVVDYLASFFGGTPYAGNFLNLFFWLSLIFLAALTFAYSLRNVLGKYFVFLFPIFLIFNFYLFQSIFILERAKYSVLVGTLFFLTIALKLLDQKMNLLLAASISSLIFLFFNGGSLLGISLFGSLFIIIFGLLLFYLIYGIYHKDFSIILNLLFFLVLIVLFSLVLNSYQILPYLPKFLNKEFFDHLGTATVVQTRDWVNYISQNTSLINILRMQGIPTWFSDLYVIHSEHPYAKTYLQEGIFIVISFILPMIAFLSLLISKTKKQKQTVFLFALITLLSMPFMAGTHQPFGEIYGKLYERFPFFFVFRTPFYKFATAFYIGISVLLAATISFLSIKFITWVETRGLKNSLFKLFLSFILITVPLGMWFLYHQELLKPDNNFLWKKGSSTKSIFPEYVSLSAEWLKKNTEDGSRVLLLPPLQKGSFTDSYTWGYWSSSALPYSLASFSYLSDELSSDREERAWILSLYDSLTAKKEEKFLEIAKVLGVKFLLLRQDVSLVDSPDAKIYAESLQSFRNVAKVISFGKWDIYQIFSDIDPKINIVKSPILIPPTDLYLSRELSSEAKYALSRPNNQISNSLDKNLTTAEVVSCLSCQLDKKSIFSKLPIVTIFPNSPLYYFKELKEKKELEQKEKALDKNISYLGFILRRASEVMSMLSLDIRDRDIANNLIKMNFYLDEVMKTLNAFPKTSGDFSKAREVLDYLDPIDQEFGKFITSKEFVVRNYNVREEIYGSLWRIKQIKNFYKELFNNIENLETLKTYQINFSDSGNYQLFIYKQSLPQDLNGQPLLYKTIKLIREGSEIKLNISEVQDDWIRYELGYQNKGFAKFELVFEKAPNLFQLEKKEIVQFPDRNRSCISGQVANFNNNKTYVVKINPLQEERRPVISIIFRDPNKIYSKVHSYLQREDEVSIIGNKLFRYIYEPPAINSLELLICSEDELSPSIEEISVQEIYSPLVVNILEKKDALSSPLVVFKKLNPTKYQVKVASATGSFILNFNEKYNSQWQISSDSKNAKAISHFLVNGFANGWDIEGMGDFSLTIEYAPQKSFYIGIVITATFVSMTIFMIIWKILKERKKA